MLKKLLVSVVTAVSSLAFAFGDAATADTQLSSSGKTSNAFITEPGAQCVRNGAGSYMSVLPPSVEGNPSYTSQTASWRPVIYRWNGTSWGTPYKYGTSASGTVRPRSFTTLGASPRLTLPSGYYLVTMQVFWHNPASGLREGTMWKRVDRVQNYAVSPIGAVYSTGEKYYCTI